MLVRRLLLLGLIGCGTVGPLGVASAEFAQDGQSSPAQTVQANPPVGEAAAGGQPVINEGGAAADGQKAAPPKVGSFFEQFFGNPLNLILLSAMLFMFLVLLPQRREMKRQQVVLDGLKKNDRVITSGGIHGVVVSANSGEPTISIRIDDNSGTRMTINRSAVATVLNSGNGDSGKKAS